MNYPIAAFIIKDEKLGYFSSKEEIQTYFENKFNTIHNWELQTKCYPYKLLIYDAELLENGDIFLDIMAGILTQFEFILDINFVKYTMPYGKERREQLIKLLFYNYNPITKQKVPSPIEYSLTYELQKDPDIKYLLKKRKLKIINKRSRWDWDYKRITLWKS